MRRVVFNQKGGVGKSTITSNLAAISASNGKRTLLIDLDAQGNSSRYLLGDDWLAPNDHAAGFFSELLSITFRPKGLKGCIRPTPFENLDILAAHPELSELMSKLDARYKIKKLKVALDALDEYDEVWIDTPPALNFYSTSALIAADACLIPFDCDDFSRQALYRLIESIQDIREDHNPSLEVGGIVVNQFQARARLPVALVNELIAEGLPVLESKLSYSVKIRESHQRSTPLIFLDQKHKLTREFGQLYDEVSGRTVVSQAGA